MSWAEHSAAIEVANEALDLLAQSVSAAIIQSQRAAEAVAQATGGNNCSSQTGREAFEMAAGLEDQAHELSNRIMLCRGAMVNYRNGV